MLRSADADGGSSQRAEVDKLEAQLKRLEREEVRLIDAYQAVADACRKHGKALGMGGINDDENARRYIGMGSRFITSGNDHSFIVSGSIERAKFYRGVAAEVGGKNDVRKKKRD